MINDSFNASPSSSRALFHMIGMRSGVARKVLVFGDMLELGSEAGKLHGDLYPDVQVAGFDLLVTVGPLAKLLAERLSCKMDVISYDDTSDAQRQVPSLLQPFDLVAVKGSHGVKLGRIVEKVTSAPWQAMPAGQWTIEGEPGSSLEPGNLK